MSAPDTDEAAAAVADAPTGDQEPQKAAPEQKASDDGALRAKLAQAERATKRLEDAARKRDEEEAAKQGEWQKLAEERAAKLEQAEANAAKAAHEQQVARVAAKLKFVDPQDVVWRVPLTDSTDEATVETALTQIAERSPHLIAKEAAPAPEIGQVLAPSATPNGTPTNADQRPAPPRGMAPLQSLAETDSLPIAEVMAREESGEIDWLLSHQQ